jgi:hypothetical protein
VLSAVDDRMVVGVVDGNASPRVSRSISKVDERGQAKEIFGGVSISEDVGR